MHFSISLKEHDTFMEKALKYSLFSKSSHLFLPFFSLPYLSVSVPFTKGQESITCFMLKATFHYINPFFFFPITYMGKP